MYTKPDLKADRHYFKSDSDTAAYAHAYGLYMEKYVAYATAKKQNGIVMPEIFFQVYDPNSKFVWLEDSQKVQIAARFRERNLKIVNFIETP